MTLAAYIEGLTITQGAGTGEPFRLLPWQRRFLRGAFGVEGDSALSISRGNGKSTLVAAIACAVVDGPLRAPRSEVVCVASSFAQGRVIFEHCRAFLEAAGRDLSNRREWRVQDSANVATIEHKATGARVRCIGSDPKRAHGLAPLYVLADEPAQWEPGKRDAMLAALRTAMGKLEGSRLIALGTRPAGRITGSRRCSTAGPTSRNATRPTRTIRPSGCGRGARQTRASPIMPALERGSGARRRTRKRDDALRPSFDALRLNLGTDDVGVQVGAPGGRDVAQDRGRRARAGPVVWGLDLGQSEAMAACAAYWPESGRLEAIATFPTVPGLAERGLKDGVAGLYVRMAERGELIATGGEACDIAALSTGSEGALRGARGDCGRPMAGRGAAGHPDRDRAPRCRASRTRAGVHGRGRGRARLPARVRRGQGAAGAVAAAVGRDGGGADGRRPGRELEAREVDARRAGGGGRRMTRSRRRSSRSPSGRGPARTSPRRWRYIGARI